mmetsp:Transcript_12957/g.37559  ORF Transcript_12957/g.37559 Transcript_12957/m.37559 type:complete len:253 (-) Transcript_12957:1275-2033(-)
MPSRIVDSHVSGPLTNETTLRQAHRCLPSAQTSSLDGLNLLPPPFMPKEPPRRGTAPILTLIALARVIVNEPGAPKPSPKVLDDPLCRLLGAHEHQRHPVARPCRGAHRIEISDGGVLGAWPEDYQLSQWVSQAKHGTTPEVVEPFPVHRGPNKLMQKGGPDVLHARDGLHPSQHALTRIRHSPIHQPLLLISRHPLIECRHRHEHHDVVASFRARTRVRPGRRVHVEVEGRRVEGRIAGSVEQRRPAGAVL